MTGLEVIAADRIDSWAGKPGVVLIDLRTEEEFRKGHIQGAVNLPYEELEEGRRPSRGKFWFCTVRGGRQSCHGTRTGGGGYQVKSVAGGLRAYRGSLLTRRN